jgi:hypothetical protein
VLSQLRLVLMHLWLVLTHLWLVLTHRGLVWIGNERRLESSAQSINQSVVGHLSPIRAHA